jgi:serine/threonine protein kinase
MNQHLAFFHSNLTDTLKRHPSSCRIFLKQCPVLRVRAIICTAVVSKHKQTSLHISRQPQALILLYAGICHGDLYGHNIMCSRDGGVLLGDFGAATIYRSDTGTCMLSCSSDVSGGGREIEKIEVRALGILMLELLQCLEERCGDDIVQSLDRIATCCMRQPLESRPLFAAVALELQELVTRCAGSALSE